MAGRLEFKGDYMGFTYNGVHSSELGIVRTSDGSRFNENLLPTMQDKTVQVPGGDGTYYFGSYYTQRQFSVSFAFDSLTETEVARIKRHFGDKQIHDLIFDEIPYKVYSAKVTGTATIKYIPFAEGETNRLYKGEGSIQFTCYYPFARCRSTDRKDYEELYIYEHLSEEDRNKIIDEWWKASRIEDKSKYPNFGDIPVSFKLTPSTSEGTCRFDEKNTVSWKFPQGANALVTLDTKTGLAYNSDGDLMNKYFSGNLCAKAPVNTIPTFNGDAFIECTSQYF